MTTSADVVVVGGGPAGLALADALAPRSSVVLLEAGERVGGMAASPVIGGQRVDLGSHRLHPSTPPHVRRLVDDLLGDDLQVRRRHGRIRLAGRWVGFPLRTGDLVRSLPPSFAARAARDALVAPLRRPRADTYAEVVRAGLGPAALATFHGPYARKLWGAPPDELAGELARRRISVSGPVDVLRTLVRGAQEGGRTFLYPRLGYGEIVERLAERASARGATMRTGVRPRAVRPGEDRVVLELAGGEQVEAGQVLWTAPAAALAAAVPGGPADAAAASRHRGLVLVYLVLDRDRWTEYDAHYLPGIDLASARISEPKNYRDGPDPAGRTVLCAEVPVTEGDDRWNAPDEELVDLVRRDLVRCGLPAPVPVEAATIRLPRVYPVVRVDDVPARDRLAAWADSVPRVHVLGRQGLVVADNLHHVLAMALDAAACVGQDGSWDAATWSAARARWATHVVED